MTQVTVSEGQTLLDIAVQYLGDATLANSIAALNNLSVTDDLVIGQTLNISAVDISKSQMVKTFANKLVNPASADLFQSADTGPQGINYWAIEKDFKVS